ncbi:MAG: sel1 repeat family protein [Colwellia sp.]
MRTSLLLFVFSLLCIVSPLSGANDLELGIYELNRGGFKAAIEQFEPLVADGYAPAQYQMALIYKNGYGVVKDDMKAFELLKLAAEQNYSDAQFELALIYSEGTSVTPDLDKAFSLTKKAAEKGLASAQFNLAVMYANGNGVKKDILSAARWYKKSANQNYALAQYNLALLYSEGKGVERSTEMSLVWNTIASWNGYANAEKSRLMDQRDLSAAKVKSGNAKASQIYQAMIEQIELKAKLAKKKDFY